MKLKQGQIAGVKVTDNATAIECRAHCAKCASKSAYHTWKRRVPGMEWENTRKFLPPDVRLSITTAAGDVFSWRVYSRAFQMAGKFSKLLNLLRLRLR